jgi:fluoride ion exporter CrcB/FEX/predicted transcriptional regulator
LFFTLTPVFARKNAVVEDKDSKDMLENSPLIDHYVLLILVIMVSSGILGGLVIYLLREKHEQPVWRPILKYAFLGIAAALTAPFFLNIFSSNLLEIARTKPLHLFIFGGFCLVFTVFSCMFLEKFHRTKFHKTEKTEEMTNRTGERTSQPKTTDNVVSTNKHTRTETPENELKILQVIEDGQNTDQALADFLKKTGIPEKKFNETLSLMIAKGLVGQKLNDKGRLIFSLTPKGKQMLSKLSTK